MKRHQWRAITKVLWRDAPVFPLWIGYFGRPQGLNYSYLRSTDHKNNSSSILMGIRTLELMVGLPFTQFI